MSDTIIRIPGPADEYFRGSQALIDMGAIKWAYERGRLVRSGKGYYWEIRDVRLNSGRFTSLGQWVRFMVDCYPWDVDGLDDPGVQVERAAMRRLERRLA